MIPVFTTDELAALRKHVDIDGCPYLDNGVCMRCPARLIKYQGRWESLRPQCLGVCGEHPTFAARIIEATTTRERASAGRRAALHAPGRAGLAVHSRLR